MGWLYYLLWSLRGANDLLKLVTYVFVDISSLKINVGEVSNLEEFAFESGCKVGGLSSSFLGLPLGASHKSLVV